MFQTNLVPAQNESPYLSNIFGNNFFMLTLSDRLAHTAKVFQGQQTFAATEGPVQDLGFFSFYFSSQAALIKLFCLFLNLLATLHMFQGKKCQSETALTIW